METELVTFISSIYENSPFLQGFFQSPIITYPILTELILLLTYQTVLSFRMEFYLRWRLASWGSYYFYLWLLTALGLERKLVLWELVPILSMASVPSFLFTVSEMSLYSGSGIPWAYSASLVMMIPISKYFQIRGFMNLFLFVYGLCKLISVKGQSDRVKM